MIVIVVDAVVIVGHLATMVGQQYSIRNTDFVIYERTIARLLMRTGERRTNGPIKLTELWPPEKSILLHSGNALISIARHTINGIFYRAVNKCHLCFRVMCHCDAILLHTTPYSSIVIAVPCHTRCHKEFTCIL